MKITKEFLRRVIKEELSRVLNEAKPQRQFYPNYPEQFEEVGLLKNTAQDIISILAEPVALRKSWDIFNENPDQGIAYQAFYDYPENLIINILRTDETLVYKGKLAQFIEIWNLYDVFKQKLEAAKEKHGIS